MLSNPMSASAVAMFPERASTVAGRVDALYVFLVGVSVFFTLLIFTLIVVFMVKYRRRPDGTAPDPGPDSHIGLEVFWSVIPLIVGVTASVWGASIFFDMYNPPPDALDIYVIGKQWMWKTQHPEGPRENNMLHIPVNTPIKLTMTSEDVIHSFYVPAFRIKQDVLPGRYTSVWFEATKTGEFHLFCAEYCGTDHSRMIGKVVVMEPAAYQEWLAGGVGAETLVSAGERLFQQYGCHTCHDAESGARGPSLVGLFGSEVALQTGQTVIADESYIRESIVNPAAKVVFGYEPIMPSFQGQISEEGIVQLIAYIRSLSDEGGAGPQP